ncbi:MAG: competence/damage-inducible protein A [Rikenellaceae bacterium]
MKASIITIGDEILIGQIVDTNSVYIAQRLNSIGVVVAEKISIGDGREQIISTIERALSATDLVIVTGGLGPTKDDITKTALAEMFSSAMVRDEMVAEHVKRLVAARGIEYNELNASQSLVPECCQVLFNTHGTAPGMWFERGGKAIVSLPGVPFEMRNLIEDEVLPRIKERYTLNEIVHRTMITAGLAESILATTIEEWESALPPYIKLAYLPGPGRVRLRLSAYEVDGADLRREIDDRFQALEQIIPNNILGYESVTIEELVHNRLTERGESLAIAESCTGGAIVAKFTAMAGASAYLLAGVVSYSNEAKISILGVNRESIERYGAVSEQVAKEMAQGARRISGADYAVATTGIAGPSGGRDEKPVGTVWFALASKSGCKAFCRHSGSDREQIIGRATAEAITLLYNEIK